MLKTVDSAIKLFGKTIPRQTCNDRTAISGNSAVCKPNSCPDRNTELESPQKDNSEENAEKSSADEQDGAMSSSRLKKPDKILPCPRCSSLETKFCYYNNYNVNQPRHFCKSCQRYWTDGGAMRNVPVGAGRRKNKSSSSHPSHSRNITSVPSLTFGSDSSLCESMASAGESTGLPGQIPWAVSYQPVPLSPYPLFYPFGYWSCWPAPWTADQSSSSSSTLGKHSRDGGILVPKTLRVDDPRDAAKSSIWSTLGIEAGKRGRLVSPLHSKCNEDKTSSNHMILHEIS